MDAIKASAWRGLTAGVVLALVLAAEPAAAAPAKSFDLTAKVGANGTATLRASGTSGAIQLRLVRLQRNASYAGGLYAGACGTSGALLVRLPAVKASATGSISKTVPLSRSQVGAIGPAASEGRVSLRIKAGASSKCGTFTGSVRWGPRIRWDAMLVGELPTAIAVGQGSYWVATAVSQGVMRFDAASHETRAHVTIDNDSSTIPLALAIDESGLWVASAAYTQNDDSLPGTVARVDPATNATVATVQVGRRPFRITTGFGAAWVTNAEDGTVSRIDEGTNSVAATITVGKYPTGIATAAGAVWVANAYDGTVSRIDPLTNTVVATVSTGPVFDVTAAAGGIWVSSPSLAKIPVGTLESIDPVTNQVNRTIVVGGQPLNVAGDDSGIWVIDDAAHAVSYVDLPSAAVSSVVVAENPFGLAPIANGTYVVALGPETDGTPTGPGSIQLIGF